MAEANRCDPAAIDAAQDDINKRRSAIQGELDIAKTRKQLITERMVRQAEKDLSAVAAGGDDAGRLQFAGGGVLKQLPRVQDVIKGFRDPNVRFMDALGDWAKLTQVPARIAFKMSKITPMGKMMQSNVRAAREFISELADHSFKVIGDHIPQSVESIIRVDNAKMMQTLEKIEDLRLSAGEEFADESYSGIANIASEGYVRWSQRVSAAMRNGDLDEAGNESVTKAAQMLRKEVMDPVWKRAAEAGIPGSFQRKEVLNEYGEPKLDASGNKMYENVPVEQNTADSYLQRFYDLEKIANDPEGFKQAWRDALMDMKARQIDELEGRLERLTDEISVSESMVAERKAQIGEADGSTQALKDNLKRAKEDLKRAQDELADVEYDLVKWRGLDDGPGLDKIVDDIFDKIKHYRAGDIHAQISPGGGGMFKHRVQVEDRFFQGENANFLKDNDIGFLVEQYHRNVNGRARMAEWVGDGTGDFMAKSKIDKIRAGYKAQIDRLNHMQEPITKRLREAAKAGDEDAVTAARKDHEAIKAETKRLEKDMKGDVNAAEMMVNRMLRIEQAVDVKAPGNEHVVGALRSVRSFNAMTMLGMSMLSSIPDLGRVIAQAWAVGNLGYVAKGFGRFVGTSGWTKNRHLRADMHQLSSALDRNANVHMNTYAGIDDISNTTSYERAMRWASERAVKMTLMPQFNAHFKGIVGSLSADRLIKAVGAQDGWTPRSAKQKANNDAWLKRMGFDDADVIDLQRVLSRTSTADDGIMVPNLDKFEGKILGELRETQLMAMVERAILKEADAMILTPGKGDLTLWSDYESVKSLLQFKTFIIGATNKMMIPMAQNASGQVGSEFAVAMTLGYFSWRLKQELAGRDVDAIPIESQMADVLLNTTGMMAYTGELIKIANDVAGTNIAYQNEAGKYRSRGLGETLFGPSYATMNTVAKASHQVVAGTGIGNDEANVDSGARAVRKLMPLQNHFLFRKGMDVGEKAAVESLGGEGRYFEDEESIGTGPTF